MIRIGLADDQSLVRDGIAMMLGSQPDLQVAWQARDGAEAIAANGRDPVDVVVMDVRMPGVDGIAATEAIVRSGAPTKVMVLTTFDLDEHALAALRAGASGFMVKDAAAEEVIAAVRHVSDGAAILAPTTTARLIGHFREPRPAAQRDWATLSPRELDVVRAVARGLSNQEIATELFLAETTVKTHVRSVLRKLDLRDRVHIVIAAYDGGLVADAGD